MGKLTFILPLRLKSEIGSQKSEVFLAIIFVFDFLFLDFKSGFKTPTIIFDLVVYN